MDDLLIFIRALLIDDESIVRTFLFNGADRAYVVAGAQRSLAAYPRILLGGEDGRQVEFSDNRPPKLMEGRVRIEIVTKQDEEKCPDALAALRELQKRVVQLLLGDLSEELPGIKGAAISNDWNVTRFRQVNPSRTLPTIDAAFERLVLTFDVQLNRRVC